MAEVINEVADSGPSESEESQNWFETTSDETSEDVDVVESPQPVEVPAKDATPAVPEVEATPATNPAVPDKEPQQPVAPVAAEPQEPQQITEPVDVLGKLTEQYALSPEDATLLITSPEEVLPKLAANMHLQIMKEVMGQFSNFTQSFPTMIEAHVKQQVAERQAQEEVFAEWPGLKPHLNELTQNILAIRKANPGLSRADLIEMGAIVTAKSKGLDPNSVRKTAVAVAPATSQPSSPPRPTGLGGNSTSSPLPSKNIWTILSEESD